MAVIQPMSYMQSDWKDIINKYGDLIEKKRAEVNSLREWSSKQPHLPSFTDTQLVFFLILAQDSLERAKEGCDRYVSVKTHHPELFRDRTTDIVAIKQVLDFVKVSLPSYYKVNLKGYRMAYARLDETDTSKLNFPMAMKVFTAIMDFELARNPFHEGLIAVFDATGLHLGFLPKINIMITASVMKYLQLLLNKIYQVHIINCNPVVSQIITLIRPIMPKELMNMIHFHPPSKMAEFYDKFVPQRLMPVDYGGELDSMHDANEEFRSRYLDAQEWIQEVDSTKHHVDESKRPKDSWGYNKYEPIMNGSFKQLTID